jgi:hypothetical protein
MKPSARGFKQLVTFQTLTSVADTSTDSAKGTSSAGTVLRCSVEAQGEDAAIAHGQAQAVVPYRLSFRVFPVDASTGARAPGTPRRNDPFTWIDRAGVTHKLIAQGPALEPAGADKTFVVECKERL